MTTILVKTEGTLRGKNLRIAGLEAELADKRGQEPEAQDVRAVFNYWRGVCDHGRAKMDPADDRWKAIRARLRGGFTVDQLKRAVDGAKVGAFVNDTGKKFDDIELICRSARNVERFIAYTEGML